MTDVSSTPLSVQSVAYAGLDALLAAMPLDLCAYLHVGEQLGPQLYLRQPTLADLDPPDAFRLFSTLRDLLDERPQVDVRTQIDVFDASVAVSNGPHSHGLWAGGRRDGLLDEGADTCARVGRAIMTVCHAAESMAATTSPPVVMHVGVDTRRDTTRAEVEIDVSGRSITGNGAGTTPVVAVATATIDALAPSSKLIAADEDTIDDQRVVLVLVRDDQGHSTVGSALVSRDALGAAAQATLIALGSRREQGNPVR